MKTIILLLSFVSVLCLISCKKDDTKASTTPTTQTPTGTTPTTQTPTGTTPTANTPGKQKYQSPSGQGRHPPIPTPTTTTICNIHNYKNFIKKPGVHNCDFRGANLFGLFLLRANLQGADLREVDLSGTNFEGADLRGAIFYGSKTPGSLIPEWEVYLQDAILTGAKVTKNQAKYLESQGYSDFVVVE